MFVIFNEKTKFPIKTWLKDVSEIGDSCLDQAYNLSNLPFIHKWVSLMPDTHMGMGMPIGGVIATKGVIIPNAVGSDIGCGMIFCETNININSIKDVNTSKCSLLEEIINDILKSIPLGKNHNKDIQSSNALDKAFKELDKYEANKELLPNIEKGYYQIGTLGGGNHFIELQVDNEGFICIMIHSGSRNFGKRVCDYFNSIAKELNDKYYSSVPPTYKLAFLPAEDKEGIQYINWMQLALDFAHENRATMLKLVQEIFDKWVSKYTTYTIEYSEAINCHHNYAALENHYDDNVWVHRKGATRARNGEMIIIPGAMGSYSYIGMGTGNKMSFCSSSHGAGRRYSRTTAMKTFEKEDVLDDLKEKGIFLGKTSKKDIAEESRFAYKDIDEVMMNQQDLVIPVKKLLTIGVVKG